jgi:hypothetical protein
MGAAIAGFQMERGILPEHFSFNVVQHTALMMLSLSLPALPPTRCSAVFVRRVCETADSDY